ncbi:hypothetical protein MLD38_015811 [Melastoma candidum]|uniref:Uncharacterized protein n=1 Tax=Melastoma candidum TaxID=119954 RepID=A0ACB9RHZ0_9MYRT|nr:hypothetical protein MLD38_015811 [Melastoma candidum]
MASGPSGRVNSGSKGFDFASDDILCSYEDYGNPENSNGSHSDPGITPSKDFNKSRLSRPTVYSAPAYSQPEDAFAQDLIATVEMTMKKYTDNLMRFLEGISSRMSQLELYCYNLDKSIGEMRSELTQDHGDADAKLKSMEKHLQEVHRSVQILRDKQELAETQKELAKLQTVQKESSSGHSHSKEDRTTSPAPDDKKFDDPSDASSKQLALALPHQVVPQQQAAPPPPQAPAQNISQQHAYYVQATQLPLPPGTQFLPADAQARMTHLQAVTAPQAFQPTVNSSPAGHAYPQYQQQWTQQLPQQVPLPAARQLPVQSQMRPASGTAGYPPYSQGQPSNAPPEGLPSSMSMQLPYSGIPPPASSRVDAVPYGYSGQGGMGTGPQQPPPQTIPGSYSAPQADLAYAAGGTHGAVPHRGGYVIYDREGGRVSHPQQQPHFVASGAYPPGSIPIQSQPQSNPAVRAPSQSQYPRNHPYSDLIEKLMNMGFGGDHAAAVIQRMEESGQQVDFNSVLDRLNVQSSGGPQRGWSG